MIIKAENIKDVDFSPFGRYFDMIHQGQGTIVSSGEGYLDCCTNEPLLDTPVNIGFTRGSSTPFITHSMERHPHTQEAQICEAQPIVFLVAAPTIGPHPDARNVKSIILPKGCIAVLDRMVWHSSSHGLFTETYYYWLAQAYQNDPTEWAEIINGPVQVVIK